MGIFRTMSFRRFSPYALCTVILTVCLFGGCGKSGFPSPKKTQDTFTITEATLSPMGNCFVARGTITGAPQNVENILLELAPIDSYDDCSGCPFVAREYGEFSDYDAQLDDSTGEFMFSYCPSSPAPMYRWRLVGKNIFRGLPHATTTPQIILMPELM